MSKQIVFRINNNGDVTLDKVEGYGAGCLEATKAIERALGKSDESSRRTTDEYEDPVTLDETESISL
jgi:GTP cyclohydrolase III